MGALSLLRLQELPDRHGVDAFPSNDVAIGNELGACTAARGCEKLCVKLQCTASVTTALVRTVLCKKERSCTGWKLGYAVNVKTARVLTVS